jgi:hypothetical protein
MKRRKRKHKQQPKPIKIRSKLALPPGIEATRAPYSNDQEESRGMARACVALNACLRQTQPREILQDIDRLIRTNNDRGRA